MRHKLHTIILAFHACAGALDSDSPNYSKLRDKQIKNTELAILKLLKGKNAA